MEFYSATSGGNCSTCVWIVGEGVIETSSAEKLLAFLAEQDLLHVRGLNVHLNSPGGSLIGGVLLGGAIRKQEANTIVSAAHVETTYSNGVRKVSHQPQRDAECSSACVFAFAGGVSRFASKTTPGAAIGFQETGLLGVHQFYGPESMSSPSIPMMSAEDRIADQKMIALLLRFLSTMEVSAELLQLAAQTDPRDMHYLTEDELRRTQIDNRMVQEVFLTGYRNGVAIAEVKYTRQVGDFRLELYCDSGVLSMLTTIDWRSAYDIAAHHRWNLYDGVSLKNGGRVFLASEEFKERAGGGVRGQLLFKFADPLISLLDRKSFEFEDTSSRYANDAASQMGFTLPQGFDGLHLLPRTCM